MQGPETESLDVASGTAATLPARGPGGAQAFLHNLWCAVRAFAFLRTPMQLWRVSWGQVFLFHGLCVLVSLTWSIQAGGMAGSFDLQALPRALFPLVLSLPTGWVLARSAREPMLQVWFPLLAGALALPYQVVFGAIDAALARVDPLTIRFLDPDVVADAGWGLWLAAIAVATWRQLPSMRAGILGSAGLAGLFAGPLWLVPADALWKGQVGPDGRIWDALRTEEAFYAQPELLAGTLAAVRAQRPRVTDLYFVGVAGYAAEDVFMQEIGVISSLFGQRFDTRGRSVSLVNNPRTAGHLPVASVTALERTLRHLGSVMDTREDVLFLYLTSHGSETHEFSLEFWPLQLDPLTPAVLRQLLDESGIRWRVIVVSACYSGGFIESLRDDSTLVITASDAEHQSFGCGAESDFTYFGRAYFDEALRGTTSFVEAFKVAREKIREREAAQGLTASNPQIYIGNAVASRLQSLEREISARSLH